MKNQDLFFLPQLAIMTRKDAAIKTYEKGWLSRPRSYLKSHRTKYMLIKEGREILSKLSPSSPSGKTSNYRGQNFKI